MQPGALIGEKYRLTRKLGAGAMGVVWAAVNQDTSREVALKLIHLSSPEFRVRLRREARAIGKLQHRNIIDIYDAGETAEGDPFLVMPLLTGETLGDKIAREGRLDLPTAARIARDIARALAVAHGAGIIHRDLKPANVFLHEEADSETGAVTKVLDFGVSKSAESVDGVATQAGALIGSPAYMSPEQARADRQLDHRADLWSLGVLFFEMLTGTRPFKGGGYQILMQIQSAPIPRVDSLVAGLDPAVAGILARCLERDLDRRIGSAAEIATALQRFVSPSRQVNALGQSASDLISPLALSAAASVSMPDDDDDDFNRTVPLDPKSAALLRVGLEAAEATVRMDPSQRAAFASAPEIVAPPPSSGAPDGWRAPPPAPPPEPAPQPRSQLWKTTLPLQSPRPVAAPRASFVSSPELPAAPSNNGAWQPPYPIALAPAGPPLGQEARAADRQSIGLRVVLVICIGVVGLLAVELYKVLSRPAAGASISPAAATSSTGAPLSPKP